MLKSDFNLEVKHALNVLFLLAITFLSQESLAQTVPLPKVQSPNTASLGTFGEVPVSHFTGTPDISIPLHTISKGSINLPIVLRYHPAAIKPNQYPGWVGLGWNLQSYGSISRVVKGFLDEDNASTSFRAYYPSGSATEGSVILNSTNWDSPDKIKSYYDWSVLAGDAQADEFTFSFLGISGKFYYTYDGWMVASDQNIKVELNGFMSDVEIFRAINKTTYSSSIPTPTNTQPRMFKGFTLTTDDGTRYIFGGADNIAGSEDAVEFISSYVNQRDIFELNTWNLKKIIDANNNEVTFNYERTYPVCNLSFYSSFTDYACHYDWFSESGWKSQDVKTSLHGGFLVWPVYLREIITTNENVSFTTSISEQLRYPDEYLKFTDDANQSSSTAINLDRLNHDINNLKWEQLDYITVKDKNGNTIRNYHFTYENAPVQRLTLKNLYELDKYSSKGREYRFAYNDIDSLPTYGGNFTDHWGFNNGVDINGSSFTQVLDKKETNENLLTKGLLISIVYPTNGYTTFDWEAHEYGFVVSTNRQSLTPLTGYAGGCRIKEIKSYPEASSQPVIKKFTYLTNFSRGTDRNTLASSGVLNGLPQYYFSIDKRCSLNGNSCDVSYDLVSINSLVSYSYNGSGSHIGYSEVIEENEEGAYTKYTFTNYGADIHGISHFDQRPGVIGWDLEEDRYITASSLELERGKPTSTTTR